MTIKELENRTGMTRANIRFYEEEGLLSPRRQPNGYRDYSEEDVGTLEKIQLLRKLQLDIDTIRKVQGGTLTLEQALFVQSTRLEGDKAVIQRAAEVCRELERAGVEYAALEPRRWLERLQPSERAALPEPPAAPVEERDTTPRACYCPWQRLFARALDMTLYDTLINLVWLLLVRNQDLIRLHTSGIRGWIWELGILLLTLALEPLWLHFWGWTPGKWAFGLKLREKDGSKLSISQGWARCKQLAWEGYGWYIPIWSQWRMWQCRMTGLSGRDCPWDGENDYRYTKVERNIHGGWIAAGVWAVSFALILLAGCWSMLPPCRGELTVADFSRNYRHFQDLLYPGEGYSALTPLDQEGRWVREERSSHAEVLIDGVWVDEEEIATKWDQPEYTLDHGRVTAVTIHMTSRDLVVNSGIRESLAFLAMSGAVDGLNTFNYDLSGWGAAADQTFPRWENAQTDYRGLHISQQVETEGYEIAAGLDMLLGTGSGERYCEKTVTISLIKG